MIKDVFDNMAGNYTDNKSIVKKLWFEIETNYSEHGRYYHTLHHLENMYNELVECRGNIKQWDAVLFSLFYHDIIYKATRKDNEEKSAELGVKRLTEVDIPTFIIDTCFEAIIATKSHNLSSNHDINLFTDADLSVLGSDWETYTAYYKAVRKEYSIYPDFLYNPGRKKVLLHFLYMENIFKTDFFREKYENIARDNISKELNLL